MADPLTLLAVGGALAALFGLGGAALRRYERTAERDVAARLEGPRKRVRLTVRYPGVLSPASGDLLSATVAASRFSVKGLPFLREPWRTARGRIDRLVLDLRDFELSGLPVERLSGTVPRVRYDLGYAQRHGGIRISRCGTGSAEVILKPEAIARWLMRRSPGLLGVRAAIEGDLLRVSGRARFSNFEVPFDVASPLVGDGPRLLLKRPRVLIGATEATGPAAEALAKALNPVVDADRDLGLRGAVAIRAVTVEGGLIVARGTVTIPAADPPGNPPHDPARKQNGAASKEAAPFRNP